MKFSGSVATTPLVRKDCHPSHSCWDVPFLTTVSHVLADVSMGRQMSLHSHRVCYVFSGPTQYTLTCKQVETRKQVNSISSHLLLL